jgi:hypothetical protein
MVQFYQVAANFFRDRRKLSRLGSEIKTLKSDSSKQPRDRVPSQSSGDICRKKMEFVSNVPDSLPPSSRVMGWQQIASVPVGNACHFRHKGFELKKTGVTALQIQAAP